MNELKKDTETEITTIKSIEEKKEQLKGRKEEYDKLNKDLIKVQQKLQNHENEIDEIIDDDELDALTKKEESLEGKVPKLKREIEIELIELRKKCLEYKLYESFKSLNPNDFFKRKRKTNRKTNKSKSEKLYIMANGSKRWYLFIKRIS